MRSVFGLFQHIGTQIATAVRQPAGSIVQHRPAFDPQAAVLAPSIGGRSAVGAMAETLARAARPFSRRASAAPLVHPGDVRAVLAYYDGHMTHRAVSVQMPAVGWHGDIAVYDSAPELAGRHDVVTVVVTHGLTTSNLLFGDIVRALLHNPPARAIRVLAVDLPGHGASACPDPATFGYGMMDAAAVTHAALDQLDIPGRVIHVTQSLGQIVAMYDVHSGRRRIAHNISVGTSPRQVALRAVEPLTMPQPRFGGKSYIDLAMAGLPSQVVRWADFFDLLWLWVGIGADQQLMQSCLVQSREPAMGRAWGAYLHGLGEYREQGIAMEQRPALAHVPTRFDLFSADLDFVMPPEHTAQHAEALERAGYRATHHAARGGHVTFGDLDDPTSLRAQLLQTIHTAIAEFRG